MTARLPMRLTVSHGIGAVAFGVKDGGFSAFLMLFYNQVLGMDAAMVSLALALALLVDALLDPVIGHLGDHTHTRWGRRLPWLYVAAIPLGLVWTLLWLPSPGQVPEFWQLVLLAIFVRALMSCCEVPSIALVAELTTDYDERSRLVRYRFLFSWIGGLIMLFLAYKVFLANGMLEPEGYRKFGIAGGALIAISVLVSAIGQHRAASAIKTVRDTRSLSVRGAFREIREAFSHPAFVAAVGAEVFALAGQGVTFATANYVYLFVWRFSEAAYQLLPALIFASVVAAFVLTGPMHRRWGKRTTGVWCALFALPLWTAPFLLHAAGLWPDTGSPLSTVLVLAFFLLANVLNVVTNISIVSMIAEVVEASQSETGRRREGTLYSGHLFAQKCATGIGILVTGGLLDWSGLGKHALPDTVAAEVIERISMGYVAVVTTFLLLMNAVLRRFPISRKDHEARVAALFPAQTIR